MDASKPLLTSPRPHSRVTLDATTAIAIIGGGPAGMALALALARHGIRADIHEARTRAALAGDQRVLALSHGSRQILDWLGVWAPLAAAGNATPIASIHVSHRGGLGRTRMTATEMDVDALGHVVPAQALIAELSRLVDDAHIDYYENTKVSHGETAPLLETHALIAWAEGAVDPALARMRDYGQHAVLCVADVAKPHGNVAWERFTDEGPVALLPLGNSGKTYAVVLACATADIDSLLNANDADFLQRLQERFGGRQQLVAVGPRVHYPLGLRWRESPVAHRQVWLGNAAQTLHPVAGQGFNLALRDVWEFAQCAASADDLRADSLLANYASARQLDRRGIIGFTNSLIDTFGTDFAPLKHARGAGLLALDLLPPLRRFVARRMMFGARGW